MKQIFIFSFNAKFFKIFKLFLILFYNKNSYHLQNSFFRNPPYLLKHSLSAFVKEKEDGKRNNFYFLALKKSIYNCMRK